MKTVFFDLENEEAMAEANFDGYAEWKENADSILPKIDSQLEKFGLEIIQYETFGTDAIWKIVPRETPVSSLSRVKDALSNSGYGHDDILSAQFLGMTDSGKEIHGISFKDSESELHYGNVYVWIENGKLCGDF